MQPQVRSLDELYNQLGSAYDPQRQGINAQVAQQQASIPDLEKPIYGARDQAFKDISQLAANRGMLFSGFTPDQQNKYTNEKFLPALTNLRTTVQGNIGNLQQALLGLDSDQRKQAMQMREQDLSQLAQWQQSEAQRQFEAQQNAAKMAQEEKLARMQLGASQSNAAQNAAAKAQADLLKQFKLGYKPNNAGYMFSGPNGRPISMHDYATATGAPMLDLLRSSPSQYDQNAYNDAMKLLNSGANEGQVLSTLQQKYKLLF